MTGGQDCNYLSSFSPSSPHSINDRVLSWVKGKGTCDFCTFLGPLKKVTWEQWTNEWIKDTGELKKKKKNSSSLNPTEQVLNTLWGKGSENMFLKQIRTEIVTLATWQSTTRNNSQHLVVSRNYRIQAVTVCEMHAIAN